MISKVLIGLGGVVLVLLLVHAPSVISIELEFFKPWTATNVATFTFAPDAGGTKATWAMDGKNQFAAEAASLFMDMDKLVGTDFERGLTALKSLAEGASHTATQSR